MLPGIGFVRTINSSYTISAQGRDTQVLYRQAQLILFLAFHILLASHIAWTAAVAESLSIIFLATLHIHLDTVSARVADGNGRHIICSSGLYPDKTPLYPQSPQF